MIDIIAPIGVLLFVGIILAVVTRRFTKSERKWIALSFAMHAVAGVAQIVVAMGVYGGGDNIFYMSSGSFLARAIEIHPERFGRLWLDALLQRESLEESPIFGAGTSTGTMIAITAALALIFRYSLYGACLCAAMIAFFGKLALYKVFRDRLPEANRIHCLLAVFIVPSAVFWSAGIQKEAFVIAGIGPVWLGIHWILGGRWGRGIFVAALGVFLIALLKPYTLFALTLAAGVWIGVDRLRARSIGVRPLYLLLGILVAYGGFVALQQAFPVYSMERLGEDLARRQQVGAMMTAMDESPGGGSSYYSMGNDSASLQKQLLFAPLAVVTALFRPLPFEANNALAFGASLEMLVLTIIVIRGFVRIGPRAVVSKLLATPVLLASFMFALLFGMGVGLATAHFGSLSRYRIPLMPFYVTVVLVLGTRAGNPRPAAAKPQQRRAVSPRGLRLPHRASRSA